MPPVKDMVGSHSSIITFGIGIDLGVFKVTTGFQMTVLGQPSLWISARRLYRTRYTAYRVVASLLHFPRESGCE